MKALLAVRRTRALCESPTGLATNPAADITGGLRLIVPVPAHPVAPTPARVAGEVDVAIAAAITLGVADALAAGPRQSRSTCPT
jgi:hypothetical protein